MAISGTSTGTTPLSYDRQNSLSGNERKTPVLYAYGTVIDKSYPSAALLDLSTHIKEPKELGRMLVTIGRTLCADVLNYRGNWTDDSSLKEKVLDFSAYHAIYVNKNYSKYLDQNTFIDPNDKTTLDNIYASIWAHQSMGPIRTNELSSIVGKKIESYMSITDKLEKYIDWRAGELKYNTYKSNIISEINDGITQCSEMLPYGLMSLPPACIQNIKDAVDGKSVDGFKIKIM